MKDTTPSHTSPAQPSPWVVLLWVVLTTLGLLLLVEAFRQAPCWIIHILIAVVAYPVWLAQRESFLFDRRILLTGATREKSLSRGLLWGGRFGSGLRVITALVLSALLLALSVRLSALHWVVLLADAIILALLYRFFQRHAASQVHPDMLGVFVRRWPLWLTNLVLLTLAFFILSFFVFGAPDLRQATWHAVAEQTFQAQSQTLACPWVGWLVGFLAALDQGAWALAQQHIPDLPTPEWRLVAWGVFLFQLSLLSLIFTQLLLGVLTLVESRAIRTESVTGESTLAKTFIVTILVLALPVLLASLMLRDLAPQQFEPPATEVLAWIDPCRGQAAQNTQTQTELSVVVMAGRDAASQEVNQRIAREVDLLFVSVESNVDDYLSWYFTVIGEYERLAALVAGDFPQLMADQLDAHLFESTGFHTRLEQIDQALVEDTLARMATLSQGVKDRIAEQASVHPCARIAMNPEQFAHLDRDVWRASAAGVTGAAAGVATLLVSKKVVATVVAKVAAKKSVQAAAALAAKMAAKKGGSALVATLGATAVCAPVGPLAIVCGMAAGVGTWLAVDKVAIEIDEAVSREAMRAEILAVVAEEKASLTVALQQRHQSIIDGMAMQIQTTLDGIFIPARDGW
jgi:hypothetical protein